MDDMTKNEIICITRQGFSLLHTEGLDFAAKVTELQYEPGKVYDPRFGVKQELLIPRFPGF
jgi:hypothetical protein